MSAAFLHMLSTGRVRSAQTPGVVSPPRVSCARPTPARDRERERETPLSRSRAYTESAVHFPESVCPSGGTAHALNSTLANWRLLERSSTQARALSAEPERSLVWLHITMNIPVFVVLEFALPSQLARRPLLRRPLFPTTECCCVVSM